MSTCSIPGEGNIEQSFLLAHSLAGIGKKVLLIEGDMRKRSFVEYFSIKSDKDLMAVLAGAETIQDAVVFHESLKADVLVSGEPAINAADILSSQTFEKVIADARKVYDYIIIDSPPALAAVDARIIGRLVDATIYTVQWDKTTQHQVADGIKFLEDANVTISGLILSRINVKRQNRLGHTDSVGAYSDYYDK